MAWAHQIIKFCVVYCCFIFLSTSFSFFSSSSLHHQFIIIIKVIGQLNLWWFSCLFISHDAFSWRKIAHLKVFKVLPVPMFMLFYSHVNPPSFNLPTESLFFWLVRIYTITLLVCLTFIFLITGLLKFLYSISIFSFTIDRHGCCPFVYRLWFLQLYLYVSVM